MTSSVSFPKILFYSLPFVGPLVAHHKPNGITYNSLDYGTINPKAQHFNQTSHSNLNLQQQSKIRSICGIASSLFTIAGIISLFAFKILALLPSAILLAPYLWLLNKHISNLKIAKDNIEDLLPQQQFLTPFPEGQAPI